MAAEHWFDQLARSLAARGSRRAAQRFAAGTIGAAFLASITPQRASAGPVGDCSHFCNNIPPGPARGKCHSDCGQTGGGGLLEQCAGDPARLCVATDGSVTCCRADEVCVNGQCVCAPGQVECGGVCRSDFSTDPQNCGACGTVCPSSARACCGGSCVNLQTNNTNCGACGTVCPTNVPNCCAGLCVNFQTDSANCGACGSVCPSGQTCVSGTCRAPCPAGQTACGNTCVNLQTDPSNCGSCGNVCTTGNCVNGTCVQCPAGQTVCGTSCCAAGLTCCSGTCVDTNTSTLHCGACKRRTLHDDLPWPGPVQLWPSMLCGVRIDNAETPTTAVTAATRVRAGRSVVAGRAARPGSSAAARRAARTAGSVSL